MKDTVRLAAEAGAGLVARPAMSEELGLHGRFRMECRGADGAVKWVEDFPNTVMNAGRDDVLNVYFGATSKGTWSVGLKDNAGSIVATQTLASKTWGEVVAYSAGARPTFTVAAAATQNVTNSASAASFSINGTATVGGAFLANNSTKSGTTGILFSAANFSGGDRAVINGDTLNVTYSVSD